LGGQVFVETGEREVALAWLGGELVEVGKEVERHRNVIVQLAEAVERAVGYCLGVCCS
jgi:hypothetical protein